MKIQIAIIFALVLFGSYAFKTKMHTKVQNKVAAKTTQQVDLWDAWFGAWDDAHHECEHLVPEDWNDEDWGRIQMASRLQAKAKAHAKAKIAAKVTQENEDWAWLDDWFEYIDCIDYFMVHWEEEHGCPWASWDDEEDWEEHEWEDDLEDWEDEHGDFDWDEDWEEDWEDNWDDEHEDEWHHDGHHGGWEDRRRR